MAADGGQSRLRGAAAAAALTVFVGACSTGPGDRAPSSPADVSAVPDAVPRAEPRSRYGNPPYYEVFGKRYYVMASGHGHVERGVASWYGEKFHGRRTSSGEPYDMYAMTAAHKTLPLPSYARVTNLSNGRSVVVRINDRGPFVDNRIVDLSYTAAQRLDMVGPGTALVELEVLAPGPAPVAAPVLVAAPAAGADAGMFVQAGAFSDRDNAEQLARRLRAGGIPDVLVADGLAGGRALFRVRVGPVTGVEDFDRTMSRLAELGISDAYLATD